MIALMQPSTVLSAVARRQRAAKRERTEMAEEGGVDNAHVGPGLTCPTCPTSRLSADLIGEDGAAANGGDGGFGGSGLARNGDRTADKGFLCGHQMVAEASVAGWEGVCSGHGAGGEDDAAATGMVVSVCGHGMHSECLQRYLDSQRGLYLDHGAVQNEHEFMCPLCRSLGNALVFNNVNIQACRNAMKLRGGRGEVSSMHSFMRVSLFAHACVCVCASARVVCIDKSVGTCVLQVPVCSLAPTPGTSFGDSSMPTLHEDTATPTCSMFHVASFGPAGWVEASRDAASLEEEKTEEVRELSARELMELSVRELKRTASEMTPAVSLRNCLEKQGRASDACVFVVFEMGSSCL